MHVHAAIFNRKIKLNSPKLFTCPINIGLLSVSRELVKVSLVAVCVI